MRRLLLTAGTLTVATGLSLLFANHADYAQPSRYIEDVKFLASPEQQGRGAGTAGIDRASQYIEDQFKKAGLKPAGENGSWSQSFKVTTSAKPGSGNELTLGGGSSLGLNKDYLPLSFSSNGQVKAPIVFAGYGITSPEQHYDDYAEIDVKGKIVLVLRYEPKQFHKETPGHNPEYTHHAHLVSKAINARNHGANAIILVNGDIEGGKPDALISFGAVAGPENAGILMIQVKNSTADQWLKPAGKTIHDLQGAIAARNQPASFALTGAAELTLHVDIERQQATVHNVLGYRPGKTKEYIVVGAHYDHLGFGNESSLAPSQIGQIHPGADDNASGTAGLLELSRILSTQDKEWQRGVLFMAFAGEEIGLLGSSEWVNHPTMPLKDAVAMINMDMIGRVHGSKLYIGGTGTGSTFDSVLKEITPKYNFSIDYSKNGFSASDHTSFASKSIPVLFFFSGLHGDYHKPSDTWDKINGKSSAEVVDLVYEIASQLGNTDARPQFVKVKADPHSSMPGDGGGGGGGYGPYFGSVPDFAPIEKGVKFSDVRAGSPAGKAGLQAGDILIGFGDKPINNLYDFTFALRGSKVGDVVKVKFLRDGKEMTADVKLEARK